MTLVEQEGGNEGLFNELIAELVETQLANTQIQRGQKE